VCARKEGWTFRVERRARETGSKKVVYPVHDFFELSLRIAGLVGREKVELSATQVNWMKQMWI
jgi:hypothetical protein